MTTMGQLIVTERGERVLSAFDDARIRAINIARGIDYQRRLAAGLIKPYVKAPRVGSPARGSVSRCSRSQQTNPQTTTPSCVHVPARDHVQARRKTS